jgi:hypothetical protein
MTATVPRFSAQAADLAGGHEQGPQRHRRRRAVVACLTLVLLVVVGIGGALIHPFGTGGAASLGAPDNGSTTSLATVTRRALSSQTSVNGTLGYAGSSAVVNQAAGVITALPAVGQVAKQGQPLYQVSGAPVVLLYGSTPPYRSLAEGSSASDVTGPDVAELNADLVALGYATKAELNPRSNEFSWWTKHALEKLQAHLGVSQTGGLDLGQAVFLPTAARVTAVSATLGAPAQPGAAILTTSSTARVVTVQLDAAQQSDIKVGDTVTITLPNNQTTPGMVTMVGTVAAAPPGSGNAPTVEVDITPSDPSATGSLDQAPVEVAITTASVQSTLVVPVDALLALGGGGYAIEVVGAGGGHSLVPVTLGLFDDSSGLVQVSGAGVAAWQRVVVPAS